MLKRIHINKHIIRDNRKIKDPENLKPPITVKTYKENIKGFRVKVLETPCEIIYSPDKPLSCGAEVYLQTTGSLSVMMDPAGKVWKIIK